MAGFGTARAADMRGSREKRAKARTAVTLKAKIFIPGKAIQENCDVVDFSADGAGLKCATFAAIGRPVILYIDGFGRFEGVVVQRDRMRLGVKFGCTDSKKKRTTSQLAVFVANGMTSRAPIRGALRVKEMPPFQNFTTADGSNIECEIVDIALGGALLRTHSRPEVGTLVRFGETMGHVLRHTDDGFAVEFVEGVARGRT